LLAPVATPPALVKRLADELRRTLQHPDVRTRLDALSISVAENSGPDAFARTIAAELQLWAGVARSAGIKIE
jgi:tripartite-type tricarboxylate transporter receptor subunit TctC